MKKDVDAFNAARDNFRDLLDLRLDTQVHVPSEGSIIDPASVGKDRSGQRCALCQPFLQA